VAEIKAFERRNGGTTNNGTPYAAKIRKFNGVNI
jgi:hypothetical protein